MRVTDCSLPVYRVEERGEGAGRVRPIARRADGTGRWGELRLYSVTIRQNADMSR